MALEVVLEVFTSFYEVLVAYARHFMGCLGCVCTCVYIYIYLYMCVCVQIYIYIYLYMYICISLYTTVQTSRKVVLGCNYGRIIPPTPNSGSEGFCLQMDGQVLLQWLKNLQEAPNSL